MFLEIITALITFILIIYLWCLYLRWSNGEFDGVLFNKKLANTTQYKFLDSIKDMPKPPRAVKDSYKVVNFWQIYYKKKY